MKVLILGNTAGTMHPMIKWLNENGHEAKLCTRREQDKLYKVEGSEGVVVVDSPFDFFKMSIKLVRSFKPDIIHLNSVVKLLPLVRLFAGRTPVIYAHHGPGKQNFIGKYDVASKLADFVQITTPDIRANGVWLDRLISDKFYDRGGRKLNTALLMYRDSFYVDSRSRAKEWAKKNNIELRVLNQSVGEFILHDDMPAFLSTFEYFLDWKGMDYGIDGERTFSVAAMEAAACGCKVIHDSDINIVLNNLKLTIPEDYFEVYNILVKSIRRKMIARMPSIFKGILLWARQEIVEKWQR